MKKSVLAALIVAALGSTGVMAQSQGVGSSGAAGMSPTPSTGMTGSGTARDDASATAGSSLDRSSQSYDSGNSGRDAAQRGAGSGTSDGMAGDVATGTQGATTGSGTMGATTGSGTLDGTAGSSGTMGATTTGSGATSDSAQGSTTTYGSGSNAQTSGSGTMGGGAQGTTTTYDSGSSAMTTGSGAAGRAYDGSTSSGPASRADVASDRDRAMRGDRWIFNDLDGLRRLNPGENSHMGRVYKGPAEEY